MNDDSLIAAATERAAALFESRPKLWPYTQLGHIRFSGEQDGPDYVMWMVRTDSAEATPWSKRYRNTTAADLWRQWEAQPASVHRYWEIENAKINAAAGAS